MLSDGLNELNIALSMCVGQWVDWAIMFHSTGRYSLTLKFWGKEVSAEGVSLFFALNNLVLQMGCDKLHISPADVLALETGLGDYIERENAVSVKVDTMYDAVATTTTMRDGTIRFRSSRVMEYGQDDF